MASSTLSLSFSLAKPLGFCLTASLLVADVASALSSAGVAWTPPPHAVGGTLALTALQWHWSWLLIRQLRKALARAGGAPAVQEAAVGWPTA